MAESYLGGHIVIGRGSGWFSRNKPKVLRRQERVHPTAMFRQAVVKAIGCSHGKAEEIRQIYVDKGWMPRGTVCNPVLLDPRILRKALAAAKRKSAAARRALKVERA